MQDDPFFDFWRKHWIMAFYVLAAIVMVASVWLWFNRIQTNPRRAFWSAISHSLSSSAVTVSASQTADGSTLQQKVALNLGSPNITHGRVTVIKGDTTIATEIIGTPKADYSRYVSISGGKQSATELAGKGILNVWAKSEPQLFGQTTLGVGLSLGSVPVPIANAHGAAHDTLLKDIKNRNLYQVNFNNVKKEQRDGRLLYTYEVSSAPFVYVEVLQLVAKQIGVTSIDSIEPGDYRELQNVKMHITVDVRAGHVVKVTFDGSNYAQQYSAYDVPSSAVIPAKTIPMDDLQKRLQSINK